MSQEAVQVVQQIYRHLLNLLPRARQYVDPQLHQTGKLVPYFAVLGHCLITKAEKLTVSRFVGCLCWSTICVDRVGGIVVVWGSEVDFFYYNTVEMRGKYLYVSRLLILSVHTI